MKKEPKTLKELEAEILKEFDEKFDRKFQVKYYSNGEFKTRLHRTPTEIKDFSKSFLTAIIQKVAVSLDFYKKK